MTDLEAMRKIHQMLTPAQREALHRIAEALAEERRRDPVGVARREAALAAEEAQCAQGGQ